MSALSPQSGIGVNMVSPVNYLHPLNRGLVAWWMALPGLSGGSGLADISGGANHGTLTNMDPVTDWVPGHDGKGYALDFDNSNDRVSIPATSALDVLGDITIAAMVYPRGVTGATANHIYGAYNTSSPFNGCALDSNGSSGSQLAFWDGTSWKNSNASTVVVNTWQLVVASVIGSTVYFYVNGVPAGSTSTAARSAWTGVRAIGARNDSINPYDGKIGWVMLHRCGFSAHDVQILQQEMQLGFPGMLNRIKVQRIAEVAVAGNRRRRVLCAGAA